MSRHSQIVTQWDYSVSKGGKSSLRFEAYKVAATLEQMLTLGGTMEDSWWDYNHGLVVVQGDVEALRPRKRKRVSQKYLKRAEVLRHRVAVADAVALALRSKKDKTTASVQVGRYICNATRGCVTERRPLRTENPPLVGGGDVSKRVLKRH